MFAYTAETEQAIWSITLHSVHPKISGSTQRVRLTNLGLGAKMNAYTPLNVSSGHVPIANGPKLLTALIVCVFELQLQPKLYE